MKLKKQHHNEEGLGLADFFQDRHKQKMFDLANLKPNDVLYDLGCGNAELLIFAVREYGIKSAVGFENNPKRRGVARKNISDLNLDDIIIIEDDFEKGDFSKADVILSTLPEYYNDVELFCKQKIKKGTRLIRHDLPIIGYLPINIDIPFYLMTFPLKKAKNSKHWASAVLQRKNVRLNDVWHELHYYDYERKYSKWDINRFKKMASWRF